MVWANIAPVLFLCNVISDVFGQHWIYDIPIQLCTRLIDTTLYTPIKKQTDTDQCLTDILNQSLTNI